MTQSRVSTESTDGSFENERGAFDEDRDGSQPTSTQDEDGVILPQNTPLSVPIARSVGLQLDRDDVERLRIECASLARRARDAFAQTINDSDEDSAETSYFAARDDLKTLWSFAHLRSQPFRDLLGLLDAALRRSELAQFTNEQRQVLLDGFNSLVRGFIEDSDVERHIMQLADNGIDVLAPIRPPTGRKLRITIEEVP